MKTLSKQVYTTPNIEKISLDNEISLALESNPPFGPSEMVLGESLYDNFIEDPFNSIGGF